jgi:hypothetical protein
MMKATLALAVAAIFLVTATAMTAFAASQTNQVSFRYVPPKNPAHQRVYKDLKERRTLEKLQEFLSPFRLPRKLKFLLAGCHGEDDASYGDDTITICYEYADKLFKNMPAKTTAAGIAPIDTVIGPFFDTCLQEFAHALFEMLKVPVCGRAEDAADQVVAYFSLQLSKVEARRVIMGAARGYFIDAESDDAAVTRKEFDEDFAEMHSTPKQRAYNLLCIAYGADTKLFGDVVSKGYLPKSRAETCEEEYEQVQDAVETVIRPHVDRATAKKVLAQTWLSKLPQRQRRRSSRRRK